MTDLKTEISTQYWKVNEATYVSQVDTDGFRFTQYSYKLLAEHMTFKASFFKQFDMDSLMGTQAYVSFSFFLEFAKQLCKASQNGSLVLLEWEPSPGKTQLHTSSWTLHIFVKVDDETKVLQSTFAGIQQKIKKKATYQHTSHFGILDLFDFHDQVYRFYKRGHQRCDIDDNGSCALDLSEVFMRETIGEGECLRVSPRELCPEIFMERYLPDVFLFTKVKRQLRYQKTDDDMYSVSFPAHVYYEDFQESELTEEQFEDFVEENEELMVTELRDRTHVVLGVRFFYITTPMDPWFDTSSRYDLKGEARTLRDYMTENQAALTDIDWIKIDSLSKKDRDRFIEEEFNYFLRA